MKLFLVRHGQTDWNFAQRFQGQSDIPLNEAGRQQAHALAERLMNQDFDAVYSSDLKRALETGKIIAKDKADTRVDPRLREIHFGDWEGMRYAEIKEKYPAALATWENDVYQNAPPGGETVKQLTERVQSALNDFHREHTGQSVLIVAHGGVLQSLICLALKLHPLMYWQFQISPASLSEIAFYPTGAILNSLNDTSHLHKNL